MASTKQRTGRKRDELEVTRETFAFEQADLSGSGIGIDFELDSLCAFYFVWIAVVAPYFIPWGFIGAADE